MAVHAGGDLAEDLEGPAQIILLFVGLFSRLPAREHHVARSRQVRMGDELDELAVASRDGDGGDHRAVAAQRAEPGELRGDAVAAVVALAVHPQRPALCRVGSVHSVGCVLGHVDESGGGPVRQVVARERGIGEASERGQALLVRQVVEFRHSFLPSLLSGASVPKGALAGCTGRRDQAATRARLADFGSLDRGPARFDHPAPNLSDGSPVRTGIRPKCQICVFRGQDMATRPASIRHRTRRLGAPGLFAGASDCRRGAGTLPDTAHE